MPTNLDEVTEPVDTSPPTVETSSVHFMPHLMKFVLENRIGVLPYEVQKEIRHYNIRDRISEIDERRILVAQ